MIRVDTTVDESLKFFTLKKYGGTSFPAEFRSKRSIKDFIENLGIPHVETGLLLLNGREVGPDSLITESSRLEVFAVEPGLPDGFEFPCFVLDVHLGKLAVNLRMLGFYADYRNDRDDAELAGQAGILLSCDRGLLMRKNVFAGMCIRSRDPLLQTAEVVRRFRLSGRAAPFSRCLKCGGLLERACSFADLKDTDQFKIPPAVRSWCDKFRRCSVCGRLYWEGSHYKHIREKISAVLEASSQPRTE